MSNARSGVITQTDDFRVRLRDGQDERRNGGYTPGDSVESQRRVGTQEDAYQVRLARGGCLCEEPPEMRARRISADAQAVGEAIDALAIHQSHRDPRLRRRETERSPKVLRAWRGCVQGR